MPGTTKKSYYMLTKIEGRGHIKIIVPLVLTLNSNSGLGLKPFRTNTSLDPFYSYLIFATTVAII